MQCDKSVDLAIAELSGDLGVQCRYCHASAVDDPLLYDFRVMTAKKQTAEFMHHVFIEGLRQRDGAPMTCASCHIDRNGKRAAKFLGEPRDVEYSMEWMNLIMVNKFTHVDGGKLRCKDCHGANFGAPAFHASVIMQAGQIELPGVERFDPLAQVPPAVGVLAPIEPSVHTMTQPPIRPE